LLERAVQARDETSVHGQDSLELRSELSKFGHLGPPKQFRSDLGPYCHLCSINEMSASPGYQSEYPSAKTASWQIGPGKVTAPSQNGLRHNGPLPKQLTAKWPHVS